MNTLKSIWNGPKGSMWADMDTGSKLCMVATVAFGLGMAAFVGHAADVAAARIQADQCMTDSECEHVTKDDICRQDGQDDVYSIQLNVEFDCYSLAGE